jgi:hypothetical protein
MPRDLTVLFGYSFRYIYGNLLMDTQRYQFQVPSTNVLHISIGES